MFLFFHSFFLSLSLARGLKIPLVGMRKYWTISLKKQQIFLKKRRKWKDKEELLSKRREMKSCEPCEPTGKMLQTSE